jgi:hypothetical protein
MEKMFKRNGFKKEMKYIRRKNQINASEINANDGVLFVKQRK